MPAHALFLITILFLLNCGTAWAVPLNDLPDVTSVETVVERRDERLSRVAFAIACQSDLTPADILSYRPNTKLTDLFDIEILAKLETAVRIYNLRTAQKDYPPCHGHETWLGRRVEKSWDDRELLWHTSNFIYRSSPQALPGTDVDEDYPIVGKIRRVGDYDFALRSYVRLLYQYGDFLVRNQYHTLYDDILKRFLEPFSGPRLSDACVRLVNCGALLGTPETENHILGTQTSRYLINQLLRKRYGPKPEWDNRTNGMMALMLERLQQLLKYDFEEYNSRPYAYHSLFSIENLHDFAEDPEVQLAARLVLDYISAKFAVSNSYLRRVVPFRRQAHRVSFPQLFGPQADELTWFFLMRSGLAQRLPGRDTNGWPDGTMLLAGLSGYQVPDLIQDLIVNQAHRHFYQRIHHDGVEIYAGTDKYLISAGGIRTNSRNTVKVAGIEQSKADDRGMALATTLIPTTNYDVNWRSEFIRFDGLGGEENFPVLYESNAVSGAPANTCVVHGFACGMNPFIPQKYWREGKVMQQGPWHFVNMTGGIPDEGLYVALYKGACKDDKDSNFCEDVNAAGELNAFRQNESFGFFEVVPSAMSKENFDQFVNAVLAKNGNKKFTASARDNVYDTFDGRRIEFRPLSNELGFNEDNPYHWGIASVNGARAERNITKWPLAEGDIINSREKTGYIEIRNPALDQTLILDFRDVNNPRRVLIDPPRAVPASGAVKALRARPGPTAPAHNVLVTVRQHGVQGTWAEASTNWQWTKPWGPISDSPSWINDCSKVTGLSQTNSALNLFGIGDDKRVYSSWWVPGGKWQDWTVIGQHQAASPVTAIESRQGQVDLFMIGPDGGIYTTYFGFYAEPIKEALAENQNLQYTGAKLPDYIIEGLKSRGVEERADVTPEAATPSDAPTLDVQSRGSRFSPSGPAQQIPGSSASNSPTAPPPPPSPTMAPTCKSKDVPCWGAWRRLGNQVAAPGSQVTAVVPRPGHLDLFVVAPDGTIKSAFREEKIGWSGWFEPRDGFKAAPSSAVTAITSDGRIDLFVIGQNGHIYTNSWERNDWQTSGWQTWAPVGNLTVSPTAQISALIPRNSWLDLFVVGLDGRVYSTFREFPARKELNMQAKWRAGGWFNIKEWKATKGSQVVSLLPRDNHIDLFALDSAGAVYTTWWEAAPGWQPWQPVGTNLGARAPCIADAVSDPLTGPSPIAQVPKVQAPTANLQLPSVLGATSQWVQQPGFARDIGANANGSVWVIGTNPLGTAGDFGIFRWTGSGWQAVDGGAVRIDVDPSGNPWVVNARGEIFQRMNNQWQRRPGSAKDIGIGGPNVYVIGTSPVGTPQDFGIHFWDGSGWQGIDGGAVQITIGKAEAWVVNSKGEIFSRQLAPQP